MVSLGDAQLASCDLPLDAAKHCAARAVCTKGEPFRDGVEYLARSRPILGAQTKAHLRISLISDKCRALREGDDLAALVRASNARIGIRVEVPVNPARDRVEEQRQ